MNLTMYNANLDSNIISIKNRIKKLKAQIIYQPKNIELLNELAGLFFEIKDYKNSIKFYEKCLKINYNAITLSNLGLAYQLDLSFQKSADLFIESIKLDENYFPAYINLGNLLGSMGKDNDLLRCSLNGLDKWPQSPELHCNVGVALMGLGMHKESRTSFETALLLDENSIDALFNIACIEAFEKNYSKAIEIYEAILENEHLIDKSRHVQTISALSYLYLRSGLLKKGWEYYDYGFDPLIPHAIKRNPNRTFSVPKWNGEDIDGKKLLIWGEQGIGDEILFASVLPDLIKNNANIIIECQQRLVTIFQRSFPTTQVRTSAFDTKNQNFQVHSDFDWHLPIGSLSRIFRNHISNFKTDKSNYLVSCPVKNKKFEDRLFKFKDKIKVGITWRSGVLNPLRNSEYTNILDWRDILTLSNIEFFNLQYGECEDELISAENAFNIKIHRWDDLDLKNDLDDVLSLIQNLDLVIGPSTTVIWLAAALGKPSLVHQYKDWINLGEDYCPFNINAKVFFAENNQPMATTLPAIKEYILENFTEAK
jgi:hypothetical protein